MVTPRDDEAFMKLAIAEAERARGTTGDNPWVGALVVGADGAILGRGHTQGPGEEHAEIVALARAKADGAAVAGGTIYSTLEPCSFHGRTPACSRAILASGVARVVTGMRDPNPRVDGEGARILRDGGVDVVEGVCEAEVRRQLGSWVLAFHPHDIARRAKARTVPAFEDERVADIAALYAIDPESVRRLL